ncbi:hypothetical protein Krac_1603 [Ktedonobacter racemifer DSM 44963]|uniref:Uncharacterized protein n=1 Tax=Ktedonobacter racemifer DSM 44963 TaxID=485913 RepID=D6U2J6_KTERA|nr:hypothetical protein Krac_1603 [Ktedonobacter racemifer DSM 44963]
MHLLTDMRTPSAVTHCLAYTPKPRYLLLLFHTLPIPSNTHTSIEQPTRIYQGNSLEETLSEINPNTNI